jgi:UV DNA damage endonuclease
MNKRIGFACKISTLDPKKGILSIPEYNSKSTTVAWLNRQSKDVAVEKLWDLLKHNIESAKRAVEYVGNLEEGLRLFRLGSDILPVYTEPSWSWFWRQSDVRTYCEREFRKVGDSARKMDVRLSFHPGQFCVLASDNPNVVERSIEEFEYHADMVRWLSFGQSFQDFKINVHISGRAGPEGIRQAYSRLSPEARNCITIENDEITWGLDSSLELVNDCALVLDLHHHWVMTGEYIQPNDDRIKRLIDSWRGVRPVLHYSYSRNEHLPEGFKHTSLPDMTKLLESGHRKQKLRAHSDNYPNRLANEWALSFSDDFDIMCESKMKNLASFSLFEFWKNLEKPMSPIFETETNSFANT